MLQQEQVEETLPKTIVWGSAGPPTTQELAQVVISLQEKQASDASGVAAAQHIYDSDTLAQAAERLNPDIAAEALFAAVQEQRRQAHQEQVMTRRKPVLNGTALAFLGGMVGACGIALFLVYTNYLTFLKYRELLSDRMQQGQAESIVNAQLVPSSTLLRQWKYFDAPLLSSGETGKQSTAFQKTNRSFDEVLDYYTQQMGYNISFPYGSSLMQQMKSVGGGSSSWSTQEGVETVRCDLQWHRSKEDATALLTRQVGPNLVNIVITSGAHKKGTEIVVNAMNSK